MGDVMADPVHGTHERDGVEPVVDTASPHDHRICLSDGRKVPAEHGAGGERGVGGKAESHDVDEAAQRRIVVVRRRIDATDVRERAEPEVPLPLTGTEEEVAPGEIFVDDRHLMGHGLFVLLLATSAALEVLEMRGDVHVDDDGNGGVRHLGVSAYHARGGEHDVGLLDQRGHVPRRRRRPSTPARCRGGETLPPCWRG